jgi:uncharacterized protein (DUF1501 family)
LKETMNAHPEKILAQLRQGKHVSRRKFLALAGAVAAGEIVAAQLGPLRRAIGAGESSALPGNVVFVYLGGGNDGLNTIIPLSQYGTYASLRSTNDPANPLQTTSIAYGQPGTAVDAAIAGDAEIAFNPGLANIAAWYQSGKVAVLEGVGCLNPTYSHFVEFDQWASGMGVPEFGGLIGSGWMGRYGELAGVGRLGLVGIGGSLVSPLRGNVVDGINLSPWSSSFLGNSTDTADMLAAPIVQQFDGSSMGALASEWATVAKSAIADAPLIGGAYSTIPSGVSGLTRSMLMAANLFNANIGTRIVHASTGGYDTHSNQRNEPSGVDWHRKLLTDLDSSLAQFFARLSPTLQRSTTVVVYSEFGRRAKMNDTLGTDHGAAGVAFVIGDNVRGGRYGESPSLTNLLDGNLRPSLDYRSLYATMLQDWLGFESAKVLGADLARIPLFAEQPGVIPTTTTTTTTTAATTTMATTTVATTMATTTVATTMATLPPTSTTLPPTTAAPTSAAPTTAAPTTNAPTTNAPTTNAPTTNAPTTNAPTTNAPTTNAPTTNAPTTNAPTTNAPTTNAPTTNAPTTNAPTTNAPTVAPTVPAATSAPTNTSNNAATPGTNANTAPNEIELMSPLPAYIVPPAPIPNTAPNVSTTTVATPPAPASPSPSTTKPVSTVSGPIAKTVPTVPSAPTVKASNVPTTTLPKRLALRPAPPTTKAPAKKVAKPKKVTKIQKVKQVLVKAATKK